MLFMTVNHDCNNPNQNESFKASIDGGLRVQGKSILETLEQKKKTKIIQN